MENTKKQPKRNNRPLTRKQQAFVQEIVNNPKQSAVKSAQKVYGKDDKPITYRTANAIASENLQKPAIISELSKYNNLVENTIINTINDWQSEDNTRKREIAVESAKWVHDKLHGKAKQSLEVQSTTVKISIDLSAQDQ